MAETATLSSLYPASGSTATRLAALRATPRQTSVIATSHRKAVQWSAEVVDKLDLVDSLGGETESGESIGHTGCVNALSWSSDGRVLASGSDDKTVCLWELGSDHIHPNAKRRSNLFNYERRNNYDIDDIDDWEPDGFRRSRNVVDLGMALKGTVETGHRANIFSVKFAPHSGDSRLFTAAGDRQMRVFDLSRVSSGFHTRSIGSRETSVWPEGGGACIRVLRCHKARAKRISTENSPDIFLSCAEDGEVRQTDLRVPHTCGNPQEYGFGSSCPPPLVKHNFELYSLSVSKMEPWLFVVAGMSPTAYLHDRRMIPRLIEREWGMSTLARAGALTQCVRRFERPPKGWSGKERKKTQNYLHISAAKIEQTGGQDLILSYSDSAIYRFGMYDNTSVLHHKLKSSEASSANDGAATSTAAQAAEDARRNFPAMRRRADAAERRADHEDGHDGEDEWSDMHSEEDHDDSHGAEAEHDEHDVDDSGLIQTDSEGGYGAPGGGRGGRNYESDENGLMQTDEEDDDGLIHTDEDEDMEEEEDQAGPAYESDENGLLHTDEEGGEDEEDEEVDYDKAPVVWPRQRYLGHINQETIKDVNYIGPWVASGSDDGRLFLYEPGSGDLKGVWKLDSHVVNVMVGRPTLPIVAVSGIDNTPRLLSVAAAGRRPVANETPRAKEIVERNLHMPPRVAMGPGSALLALLGEQGAMFGIPGGEAPPEGMESECVVM